MARRLRSFRSAFRADADSDGGKGLSIADRSKLIDTALDLLDTLYVHLPLKRSMYAVNPSQRLKLLRRRSDQQQRLLADREFFNEMLSIFGQLRDLHTNFVLPEPFRSSTAYLPFRLERCVGNSGQEWYVVTQVVREEVTDNDFQVGAIVTHWNGTPIRRVVEANADREAGSNPAARFAQGLAALTMRWLGQSILPDEEWVDIVYLPKADKHPKQIRFEWRVFRRDESTGAAATAIARAQGANIIAVGMDARGEAERQIRQRLFNEGATEPLRVSHFADKGPAVRDWARDVFPVCANVHTRSGAFAYVKIATFNVDDEKKYIEEFIRVVEKLSQRGLILDVRGNLGGLITFGERMLQLLTPRTIDPARFSFLNSERTQELTADQPSLRAWQDSIAQWIETGAQYSQGFPLLASDRYNDIGQKYQGPVVLITDALCYSTTDIFAAGFQDHNIGRVLGVDESTGAGGANVWDYSLISPLLSDRTQFPAELPGKASLRIAIRRVTRVGVNSGVLLEDLGVKPDEIHHLTRHDLLHRNVDLISHAAKILRRSPRQRLTAERQGSGKVRIVYCNLNRIDAYLDDRPLTTLNVKRSRRIVRRSLTLPVSKRASAKRRLLLQGYRCGRGVKDDLVAATRITL
jgi:C-terminal processing protease CtpA/Prc